MERSTQGWRRSHVAPGDAGPTPRRKEFTCRQAPCATRWELGRAAASTDSKKAGTGLPSRSGIHRYPETLDVEGNGKVTIRRGTCNGDCACAIVQRPTTDHRRTTT